MENRTLRIFLCCFISAGIGTLISLEVNKHFWWIGVLAGGFLGYLSYDFKKVILAIPKAWIMAKECKIDWHRVWTVAKSLIIIYISVFGLVINIAIMIAGIDLGTKKEYDIVTEIGTLSVFTAILSVFGLILAFMFNNLSMKGAMDNSRHLRKINFFRVFFTFCPLGCGGVPVKRLMPS